MGKKRIFLFLLIVLLPIVTLVSYRQYQSYKETQRKAILLERRKSGWMALKQTLSEQIAKFNGEVGVLIKDVDMS